MGSAVNKSRHTPMPPLDARRMLREAGLRPRKSLGQNFLVDESALERVADAAGIQTQDIVLEIGAGLGGLTRHLAVRAGRVVAVEIDPQLIPILQFVLLSFTNVAVVPGDILAQPLEKLIGKPQRERYKVAANIPYYITSAIIRKLVESNIPPSRVVLTVQKEVASRICASPGKMNLLALSVQYYGAPSIVGGIPAKSFYPVPDVDSAIVKVELNEWTAEKAEAADRLFRVARAGFSQKRKKLRNTLSSGLQLPVEEVDRTLTEVGIDPARRAETLAVDEWIILSGKFHFSNNIPAQ